jgi:hypothetical protein
MPEAELTSAQMAETAIEGPNQMAYAETRLGEAFVSRAESAADELARLVTRGM